MKVKDFSLKDDFLMQFLNHFIGMAPSIWTILKYLYSNPNLLIHRSVDTLRSPFTHLRITMSFIILYEILLHTTLEVYINKLYRWIWPTWGLHYFVKYCHKSSYMNYISTKSLLNFWQNWLDFSQLVAKVMLIPQINFKLLKSLL